MEYRRDYTPGASYFFTLVTAGRRPILATEVDRLRRAFKTVKDARPFKIEAIVILPDHLHTLWTLPEGDSDYSLRWQQIKRLFSAGLPAGPVSDSQRARGEKGIWQRRFWEHRVRNQQDWNAHLDYIHYNPVKHGYVPSPGLWPYSSFRKFVASGHYPADWGVAVPEGIDIRAGE